MTTISSGPLARLHKALAIALAVIAQRTEHAQFDALVTPVQRRRLHEFAREPATLDWLGNGRLVVDVRLGVTGGEIPIWAPSRTLSTRPLRRAGQLRSRDRRERTGRDARHHRVDARQSRPVRSPLGQPTDVSRASPLPDSDRSVPAPSVKQVPRGSLRDLPWRVTRGVISLRLGVMLCCGHPRTRSSDRSWRALYARRLVVVGAGGTTALRTAS